MRITTLAALVAMAGACASRVPPRCDAKDPVQLANARIVARPVCASGSMIAVEFEAAPESRIQKREDAEGLVREYLPRMVGKLLAVGLISFASTNRSTRYAFYEGGVLELHAVQVDHTEQQIREFVFWPYREVTDHFEECTEVLTDGARESAYQLVGPSGAFYSRSRPSRCGGGPPERVLASGPVDRRFAKSGH